MSACVFTRPRRAGDNRAVKIVATASLPLGDVRAAHEQKPLRPEAPTHCTDTLSRPMYFAPCVPCRIRLVLAPLALNDRVQVLLFPLSPLNGPHVVCAYGGARVLLVIDRCTVMGP